MNNELTKEEELAEILMQSTSVQASVILLTDFADQQSKKEAIAFIDWVAHGQAHYRFDTYCGKWRGSDNNDYINEEDLYQLYCSQVVTPLKGE